MQSSRVEISEFRQKLSSYLESPTPVAITRNGATIGIYVPTSRRPSEAELEQLRAAGQEVQALIATSDATEGEIVKEFDKARRRRRKQKS